MVVHGILIQLILKMVSCAICSKDFKDRLDNLKRHMDDVHLKKNVVLCKHCGTRCSSKEVLKRHLQNTCKFSSKEDSSGQIQAPNNTNPEPGN